MRNGYFVRGRTGLLGPRAARGDRSRETGPPTEPTGRSACFFGRASHTINVWFLAFTLFPRSNMARCVTAKITGVAGYVPPRVLTNADLEKMVDTTNEWIMERVGIRERHIVDDGMATSHLAVEAVRKLQALHPFDLQSIDLIVVGTVTPDMMYPSTACLVQDKLGMK